jgi:hypothetical protein
MTFGRYRPNVHFEFLWCALLWLGLFASSRALGHLFYAWLDFEKPYMQFFDFTCDMNIDVMKRP